MSSIADNLKVKIQYFLPKKLISRALGLLASKELGKTTTFLIEKFVKHYNVNLKEAEIEDINAYKTFNAFFTRSLKKDLRPIADDSDAVVHPADGTISEFGKIYKDAVLQAKGHYYSLEALLGGNEKDAKEFENGSFMTTYLSPADYHRVHMPLTGTLEKMIFVPGELFSVNPLTARNVDNLFAINERAVCFFKNDQIGRFAVVMVGATVVASISTVFAGTIAPSNQKQTTVYDYTEDNITLKKGEELGFFSLGSTTVCIFPENSVCFDESLKAKSAVKMGSKCAEMKVKAKKNNPEFD